MTEERYKRKTALALKYEQTSGKAPYIAAKGKGIVAENILESAAIHNVPIQEDPTLIELLGNLEINESIPEELFDVVAEIFAFIYQIDKNKKNQITSKIKK